MSKMTKSNKNNLLDAMNAKKIVLVTVMIAITGMFVFSSVFVNPLFALTDKSNDRKEPPSKSTDGNNNAKTTTRSDTSSSASNDKDYKNFQKCLSNADGTKGFATKTEIQDCFRSTYLSTTTSSSSSTTSTSPLASSTNTT